MRVGIPKEIKDHEYRVGLTPAGAARLVAAGHDVYVEHDAGAKIGLPDAAYAAAGAKIADSAREIYACDLVVKVKEPQRAEYALLRENQMLFCYLHLAAEPVLAGELENRGTIAIGYETVVDNAGRLPLLTPMSVIAGRLSVQAGAFALTMAQGGSGVLLSGAPGVPPARVMVLGAGVVGSNAARLAHNMGADVTVFDINTLPLEKLEAFGIKTCHADSDSITKALPEADLVIGATLVAGQRAPKLVSREKVQSMKTGSAIVDVSIDQGGSAETSRPTTHSSPTYIEEGVVHYCVTNMPAAAARTATFALTQATLPHVLQLADSGFDALGANPGLASGLQVCRGKITHQAVAAALGAPYTAASAMLSNNQNA